MSGQPFAVRFSAPAAKVLNLCPSTSKTWWDALDAADDDPEGEGVRHASVGQLSLTYWVNRPLRRLSVLTITWPG